jgi:hypothetical protein
LRPLNVWTEKQRILSICTCIDRRFGTNGHAETQHYGHMTTTKIEGDIENMASYAICSSLILVIHDNMTNDTNNIVKHVFVDFSRSQGCKNST